MKISAYRIICYSCLYWKFSRSVLKKSVTIQKKRIIFVGMKLANTKLRSHGVCCLLFFLEEWVPGCVMRLGERRTELEFNEQVKCLVKQHSKLIWKIKILIRIWQNYVFLYWGRVDLDHWITGSLDINSF